MPEISEKEVRAAQGPPSCPDSPPGPRTGGRGTAPGPRRVSLPGSPHPSCAALTPGPPPCRPIKPADGRAAASSSSTEESAAYKERPARAPAAAQPATLKPATTGRRSRSDSPKSEAAEEQPVKRQNSMGLGAAAAGPGGRAGGQGLGLHLVPAGCIGCAACWGCCLRRLADGVPNSPAALHCAPSQMTRQ